ncbi:MAG: hypothetical protein LUC44_04020, partial [Prevotellaceae bacterium]|nr:hypothetical protein [Prevotellaceae bacterium]
LLSGLDSQPEQAGRLSSVLVFCDRRSRKTCVSLSKRSTRFCKVIDNIANSLIFIMKIVIFGKHFMQLFAKREKTKLVNF